MNAVVSLAMAKGDAGMTASPEEKLLNLKGTQFAIPTPPSTTGSDMQRRTSPAPSESTLSSIQDVSSTDLTPVSVRIGSTDESRPAKRRKLTVAEKAEQQRVKEVKQQEKLEHRAKKDEEKRVKDEERRKKGEEREAKKREKELEEERKNQEKIKKERSQMRLGAFFAKPSIEQVTTTHEIQTSPTATTTRRRSLSLETYDSIQDQIASASKGKSPCRVNQDDKVQPHARAVASRNDYHAHFMKFVLKPNTSLYRCQSLNGSDLHAAQERFDAELSRQPTSEELDLGLVSARGGIESHFSRRVSRGQPVKPVSGLIDQLNSSLRNVIDLTHETSDDDALHRIAKTPMRYLHFHEDVRPAYYGSYTRLYSIQSTKTLRRKPFSRVRPDTDYDYDSEAEWEEPDPDGEDLDIEESDKDSEADDDELEGFLDDEDDKLKHAPKIVADILKPQSTDICWENEQGMLIPCDATTSPVVMSGLRIQCLLPDFKGSAIDPFCTSYWQTSSNTSEVNSAAEPALKRTPLQERDKNSPASGAKRGPKPGAQKSMDAHELDEFRAAIVGSTLGKNDLLAMLKTKFPNFTSVLVKDTLSERFAQVGKSKADKKWMYFGG